jgi:hypothetical protein
LGGKCDRIGIGALMFAVIFSSRFATLVFFGNAQGRLRGMTLWGMGMGTPESIWKAAVAGLVPADKRGSAYGIFNTAMAYHMISGQFGDGNFVRSLNYLAGCIFSCDPTRYSCSLVAGEKAIACHRKLIEYSAVIPFSIFDF